MADKIFFDTAPFVYLIENHTIYKPKIVTFLTNAINNNDEFVTSILSYSEFCVMPERLGKLNLIQELDEFLTNLDFELLEINLKIAKTAAKLRAKYISLKGIDSLQLATAIEFGCNSFFTNDKKLATVQEIVVVVVDEL